MLQSLTKLRIPSWTCRQVVNLRWYSDDEKFDKKEKPKKEKPERKLKNTDAISRINSLIEEMSANKLKAEIKIQTAKKKKKLAEVPPVDDKKPEKDIKVITAAIAKKIGGDTEQTEKMLLSQILGTKDMKSSGSLGDIISGMQVEKEEKPISVRRDAADGRGRKPSGDGHDQEHTRADSVRKAMGQGRDRFKREFTRRNEIAPMSGVVNLFGSESLGIFEKASDREDALETWAKLQQRELKLAITHPPSNYFEKMIQWTEQGKLWRFPIDNEQDWHLEKDVDFSAHVLLEMFIEDWCPPSGPVRHFMELICVGLSKNHWLTAQEKRDHIDWYRGYFEEKKDLLGDLMTLGKEPPQKQVEASVEA